MRYVILLLTGLFAFVAFYASTPTSAVTTVPTKLNFQGRLTDSAGTVKPSGTYNMRFKLFTVASGGTNVWAEDRLVSASQGVTVTNGQFSVQLGSVTSLPASLFASGALYLEVELPTPATATTSSPSWTEGAMTPRNQMATSAYAYNAETLDGLDSANFGQIGTNNTWTGDNIFYGSSFTANTTSSVELYAGTEIIINALDISMQGAVNVQSTLYGISTISGTQLISRVATGTAPLTVASTTLVTNLNADLLDGQTASFFQDAANLNAGTVSGARISGSYTGITGTGALTVGSIASGFGTISTANTISGTRLISTVATGTAPMTISSTTKVTSLNADLLDGLDSTAFGDATAANQTTILNRIGTNADAAGTTTVFARLASIDTSKLGATGDAANATGSIFARLAYLISSIGATTDAASSTGSVNAKLAYIIANIGGGVASDNVQVFTTSGTWTKPAGAKYVDVYVIGGGGSGVNGSYIITGSSTASTPGGYGGGGGGLCRMLNLTASDLPATITATVGAGGAAPAADTPTQTTTTTTMFGAAGNNGTASTFAGLATAPGGSGATYNAVGVGGVGCTGTGGDGGVGGANGFSANTPAQPASGTNGAPGGGGGGAGVGGSGCSGCHGIAGIGGFSDVSNKTVTTNSTESSAGAAGTRFGIGGGGSTGGGAGGNEAAGGAGGAGICGSGGGGGGAMLRSLAGTQVPTGRGGAGGSGCIIVVTRF